MDMAPGTRRCIHDPANNSSWTAVKRLNGRTNSYHQDTKAPRKTGEIVIFPFAFLGVLVSWCLGALVVNFSVFFSVLSAFAGNFNNLLNGLSISRTSQRSIEKNPLCQRF
jgi:hypothetical protein